MFLLQISCFYPQKNNGLLCRKLSSLRTSSQLGLVRARQVCLGWAGQAKSSLVTRGWSCEPIFSRPRSEPVRRLETESIQNGQLQKLISRYLAKCLILISSSLSLLNLQNTSHTVILLAGDFMSLEGINDLRFWYKLYHMLIRTNYGRETL